MLLQSNPLTAPSPAVAAAPLVEVRGLTKRFPGVVALDRVDLAIEPGEVHILVGENGAGKSSLVKALCGIYKPDEGEMYLAGRPFRPLTPLDALRSGMRVVHQELNLLPNLSVAENVEFEALPSRFGFVDTARLQARARSLLQEVGLDVPPGTLVEKLGIAQMQLVEIAKALSGEARVLILDEPTATLTPKEINRLFQIIRRLKGRGIGILYISHHLHEMFEIGDRVTVLRNGRVAATHRVTDVTLGEVMSSMVGRVLSEGYPFRAEVPLGSELLRVEGLRYPGNRAPIDFAVREGEILGIAGLVGSGRTEAMRAIFGADQRSAGRILLRGKEIEIRTPADAVRHGICLLTEDRRGQGLLLDMSCAVNVSIAALERVTHRGLLDRSKETLAAQGYVQALRIRTPSVQRAVRDLSGGNQQKVVVAKWLFADGQVLIFDEPTRGIDVGARLEIYALMWDLAQKGRGLIMVSSDLPELLGVCHRIAVFSRGALVGELERSEFSEQRVLELAFEGYLSSPAGASAAPAEAASAKEDAR